MKVHLIAIGGSVMHQLAIALKLKGYLVTGSDDEIFEPARSNLEGHGLLPAPVRKNFYDGNFYNPVNGKIYSGGFKIDKS